MDAIRRAYNLWGQIAENGAGTVSDEGISGPASFWVDTLSAWRRDYRLDTYIFWPGGEDKLVQIEAFIGEVTPVVAKNTSA